MLNEVVCGDSLGVMAGMESNSIDTVITDPPYGLSKQPDIVEVLRCWLDGESYKGNGGSPEGVAALPPSTHDFVRKIFGIEEDGDKWPGDQLTVM